MLPGGTGAWTVTEIANDYGPVDWYPGDHPKMPEIVAHGDQRRGIRACALCHFPNGTGKPENAPVSGTSEESLFAPSTLETIVGWGTTSEGGDTPDTLQKAQVPIVADSTAEPSAITLSSETTAVSGKHTRSMTRSGS